MTDGEPTHHEITLTQVRVKNIQLDEMGHIHESQRQRIQQTLKEWSCRLWGYVVILIAHQGIFQGDHNGKEG